MNADEQKELDLDRKLDNVSPATKFASINFDVFLNEDVIAHARSKNMAARIARALNDYLPNSKGR